MPDWDTSDLTALARDFDAAAAKIVPALVPTAQRAGSAIKRTMRRDATGHRRLPGLGAKVEFEVSTGPRSVEVEVGFRKEGQGNLANIAAFGTSTQPPVMDVTRGLVDEAPKFMRWAAIAAVQALS